MWWRTICSSIIRVDFKEPVQEAQRLAEECLELPYPWVRTESVKGLRRRVVLAVAYGQQGLTFSGYQLAIDATILKVERMAQVWTLELIRALVNGPERPQNTVRN